MRDGLPSGFDHWLLLSSLLVKALVCFEDLHHTGGHGVLSCWILDVWPEIEVGMCSDLVVVWADVETSSLAGCNRLW